MPTAAMPSAVAAMPVAMLLFRFDHIQILRSGATGRAATGSPRSQRQRSCESANAFAYRSGGSFFRVFRMIASRSRGIEGLCARTSWLIFESRFWRGERQLEGDQLVQSGAEAPDVGTRVGMAAVALLLRGHVQQRAQRPGKFCAGACLSLAGYLLVLWTSLPLAGQV